MFSNMAGEQKASVSLFIILFTSLIRKNFRGRIISKAAE